MREPPPFPASRPRRLRRTAALRGLVRETDLSRGDLAAPLFVKESITEPVPVASMPGHYQHTLESLRKEAAELAGLGVPALLLFGVPAVKDAEGSQAWAPDGIVQQALRALEADLGDDVVLIGDLCLCEYTDHGHCGVLGADRSVVNDAGPRSTGPASSTRRSSPTPPSTPPRCTARSARRQRARPGSGTAPPTRWTPAMATRHCARPPSTRPRARTW